MLRLIITFLLTFFILNSYADNREKIIEKLNNISNLSFDFEQNVNGKVEIGNCIIEYPKKLFCTYNNINKKIMISNGKSLAIKNQTSNQYYRYPLKRTPLELILNKDYLINQIKNLEPRAINDKYIKSGSYNYLLNEYRLDNESVIQDIEKIIS